MNKVKKSMILRNNRDYENCLTINKIYDVEIEDIGNEDNIYIFIDDNGDELQTMIHRFEDVSKYNHLKKEGKNK